MGPNLEGAPSGDPGPGRARLLRESRTTVLAAAVAAFGLVVAAAKVWDSIAEQGAIVRIDQRWLSALAAHRMPWATAGLRVVTWLGDWRVLVPVAILAAVVLALRRRPTYAVLVLAATFGSAALGAILKVVLARPRPPISGYVVSASGSAYPSGHATQAAACYATLAWVLARHLGRRWHRVLTWLGAGLCVGLVGFSRAYLGVHWPSDVGSGWAVGAAWAAVCVGVVLTTTRGPSQGPWALPGAASARSP